MTPGSVFFDEDFEFHDGESGEKLFIVLGTANGSSVVAKTTSKQHGRGTVFGCQKDRFYNFYLPPRSTALKKNTWICLDEFYEYELKAALQKRFDGKIKPVCTIVNEILRKIQDCAVYSDDISARQLAVVNSCLV